MSNKKNSLKATVAHREVTQWQGPLPPPESLERYNDILPNAAERIMAMAEKEMEHRHKKEYIILEQDEAYTLKRWKLSIISTILGFLSVIILSFLVGYAIHIGADNVALGTAIGAIAAVAGLFTYSKLKQGKDVEKE